MRQEQQHLETYQVDAFTSRAFGGNPAEVVLIDPVDNKACTSTNTANGNGDGWPEWLDERTMQAIAAENNLSETAFVQPVPQPLQVDAEQKSSSITDDIWRASSRFRLRWFTPTTEVNLCGHATLAVAFTLFRVKHNPHKRLVFETLSGDLSVDDQTKFASKVNGEMKTIARNLVDDEVEQQEEQQEEAEQQNGEPSVKKMKKDDEAAIAKGKEQQQQQVSKSVQQSEHTPDFAFVMQFPANDPDLIDDTWKENTEVTAIIEAVLGSALNSKRRQVLHVALSARTRKLLIHVAQAKVPTLATFQDKTGLSDGAAVGNEWDSELSELSPDLTTMKEVHDGSVVKGVIVTAEAIHNAVAEGAPGLRKGVMGTGGVDFVSRYFAPWNGIDEDPVTGSAHTVLCPYWADILKKSVMSAKQTSKRGGHVNVRLSVDRNTVYLSGDAVLVRSGRFHLRV